MKYAGPVWRYTAKTHLNKLEVFQIKVLRIIATLPKVTPIEILHEQTGIETIKIDVRRLTRKLYFKSQFSDTSHIRLLGKNDPIVTDKRNRTLLVG
jgi:hypothetical protein